MTDIDVKALAALREPFPASQVGKLPKGGVQLDFVGHGFITARLLDVDAAWNWRPMSFNERGLPQFDEHGGLWMYVTVGGVERIGYGGPSNPAVNAIKEAIGDGLRNGSMRFGVALDLWCKGDPNALAPKPKISAAVQNLAAVVKKLKLDNKAIGKRFQDDYGMTIYEADDAIVEGFTKVIEEEEAEKAEAALVDEAAAK